MSAKSNGGPAFPSVLEWRTTARGDDVTGCNDNAHDGMTLRDYFAAKVIAGFASQETTLPDATLARRAYALADAMLAARAKTEGSSDV
jgi:hypothetical protein